MDNKFTLTCEENNVESALLEAKRRDLAEKHALHHYAYYGIPFDAESFKREKGWACICEYLAKHWTIVKSLGYQGYDIIMLEDPEERSVFVLKITHHEVSFDWFHHAPITAATCSLSA